MANTTTSTAESGKNIKERPISFSDLEFGAKIMFGFIEQKFREGNGHIVPSRQDLIRGVGNSLGFSVNQARACIHLMEGVYSDKLPGGYKSAYAATG